MRKLMFAFMAVLMGCAGAVPSVSTGQTDMIGVLRELPLIYEDEAAEFPQPGGAVMLTLDGERLPYDEASNTYFVPQPAEGEGFVGEIEVENRAGWEYFLCADVRGDKNSALKTSIGYDVYGVCGNESVMSKVIFTALPVLCMVTENGELPGDDDTDGELSIFSADGDGIHLERAYMEINERGNTSRRLPKKSYRVKIRNEQDKKKHISIAGLRSDDDWILNPMYSDTSKIREKLAYELWAEINSSGKHAVSSRLEYAEVFINGDYWGLYGVQERIDRKQVDSDKRSGILYKVKANDHATAEELLACTDDDDCGGFEVKHAGDAVTNVWGPLAAYVGGTDGAEVDENAAISLENAIDYGLWAMLTQAHDCHFKNQYLNCVYSGGGYVIHKIPWDLNNTFGDVWDNDSPETNHTDYRIGSLVMDDTFELLIDSGDSAVYKAIQARWSELRSGAINEEAIVERARAMHGAIFPATVRDSRRWPECGMGEGNARNIRDIEDFVYTILLRMDEYVYNLGTDGSG